VPVFWGWEIRQLIVFSAFSGSLSRSNRLLRGQQRWDVCSGIYETTSVASIKSHDNWSDQSRVVWDHPLGRCRLRKTSTVGILLCHSTAQWPPAERNDSGFMIHISTRESPFSRIQSTVWRSLTLGSCRSSPRGWALWFCLSVCGGTWNGNSILDSLIYVFWLRREA
jgi:hypothetical protein